MKGRTQALLGMAVCAAAILGAPAVSAQEAEDGEGFLTSFFGAPAFDFGYGGFIRNEVAVKITSDENPYNQSGNTFNGRPTVRNSALGAIPEALAIRDVVTRTVPSKDNSINLEYVRGELEFEMKLTTKLRLKGTFRALFDPDLYHNFDPDETAFVDPYGPLQNEPNLFEYRYDGGPGPLLPAQENARAARLGLTDAQIEALQRSHTQSEEGSGYLEIAGEQYFADMPRLYFDFQNGGLLLRLGIQQIAWGDLLFFRILDVPNGLDLRRHSILDFVPEEFSDKRVPSLGLRASYLLPYTVPIFNGWEIDSYVQRFRSTIFGNPNTPYNVIPSQFTVHDQFNEYDDEYNYGVRFRGSLGAFNFQFVINRRYNHFGVFQWTDADSLEGLQPLNPTGLGGSLLADVDALLGTNLSGGLVGTEVPATGTLLADTPFEVDPTGVVSGEEFAYYGALVRLDHYQGINEAIENFPAAQVLGASEVSSAAAQERQEDIFTSLSSGLRGHISRQYFRENNFGFGIGYLIGGWNIDLEAKYTPDRHYTPLTLSPEDNEIIVEDEYEIGMVAQSFYRYSATFPAAFVILQYLHRSESDIFNRHLSGFGGDADDFDNSANQIPDGVSSFNALVFAFQQPFPNRIWRIDFASLLDVQGGLLVQLGLRYKPSTEWTFQIFGTVVETIYGEDNENALSTVDFADEITTRVTYQF